MKLLGKILVPVDVTSNSTGQINATIKLATEFNSEVFLLYVIPDEELHAELKKIVLKEVSESLDEIRKTLSEAKVNVREPLIATGRVVSRFFASASSSAITPGMAAARLRSWRASGGDVRVMNFQSTGMERMTTMDLVWLTMALTRLRQAAPK